MGDDETRDAIGRIAVDEVYGFTVGEFYGDPEIEEVVGDAVLAELRRRGWGDPGTVGRLRAVVLSPEAFESLIGSAEAWQEVFDRERENDLVSDAISSARAQLFSQRGDDEA